MRAGYGRNSRELLTGAATPLQLLDFGDLPVFEEATTYPSIVMVEKSCTLSPALPHQGGGRKKASVKEVPPPLMGGGEGEGASFLAATFTYPAQLSSFAQSLPTLGFTMPVRALSADGWTLERPQVLALMAKLRAAGKPLGEYVDGKFYYGIKTGLNEAFVIDEETRARLIAEDPKSAEIIKPWLRGRDIKKWRAEASGGYILYIPWHFEIEKYPAVLKHLEQFKDALSKRN